ncbi:MAG: hypothetical protein APF76_17080 [Desulfitibacter sp. BRH_c19]|nr:MAG: hypothetical protein APF76_17080 [Desulfitibacter sp. BRH_c19]
MKILLAVDGSENSQRAAEKALEFANQLPVKITVISVLTDFIPSILELSKKKYYENLVESHKRHNEDILDRYKNFFKENNVEAEVLSRFGPPVEEICKEAEKGQYSFLIIGSRGLSNLKKTVMGSVSYNIVHCASIPVMVVK